MNGGKMFEEPKIPDCKNCEQACCFNCFPMADSAIFECLNKDELEYLMNNKRKVFFKPGETIIKQNTSTTDFVCISEGIAKVLAEGTNGKNVILRLVKTHDLITAGGIISDDIRHFTVSAITKVECCFIDSTRLQTLLARNSNFSYELLKYNNKKNIEMLNGVVGLTQKYMPGRVADTILYLKNQIYKANPFTFNLSRQEMAEMSGMTKESFIRSFKELENSGIVKHDRTTIEILHEDDLVKISKNG